MEGTKRGRTPPLEVRREFTTSRLEAQVLAQTYERVVPMVRKPVLAARTLWDLIEQRSTENPSQRPRKLAQGA